MGYQGDMYNKMTYNKSLIDLNRGKFNDFKNPYMTYKKSLLKIQKTEISAEKFEIFKIKLKRNMKKRNIIAISVTIISVIVILVIILHGLYLFMNMDVRFRF
ncbi:MAG: hypothetical protein Q7U47_15315 [Paludibacter sp.]|nr:hypothetical protein [Paludibacter sp.]